jgi:hypothetical protein
MAEVDFDMHSIADGRSPAGVKLDLQEAVEALLVVVTRFGTASVTPQLANEVGWLRFNGSHLILHAEWSASILLRRQTPAIELRLEGRALGLR